MSGIFVPSLEARDPRARGSFGAGLVLDVGVTATATFAPGGRTTVLLSSDVGGPLGISESVAQRLLGRRPGRLSVHLRHALPIGQGFGSSAAGALATGLAVASALELPRAKAVEVAHLSDLFGGGGLGGVAAILGGGLEVRVRPGIPPFGRVTRLGAGRTVLVGTVGPPIRTPEILGSPNRLRRFEEGRSLFEAFAEEPSWEKFWTTSETFGRRVALASRPLTAVLAGLRRRGARAIQAMFGESFAATLPPGAPGRAAARWLAEHGVAVHELRVASRGARTLRA